MCLYLRYYICTYKMAALDETPATIEESPESESPPPEVEKRTRGRPKGSVDRLPRKRTKIVEEAVEPPPPPPPPAPAEPVRMKVRRATPTPAQVQAPPPEPPSPRTLFKQATETIHQLQTQREHARRDYWADQIAKSLR
jgi:hypothetical protein